MSAYTPDCWVIIEFESAEYGKTHKVLASWYGGYAGSNSWKLSSGIEGVSYEDGIYTMPQTSGSVYVCHENSEHMSGIMHGVFSNFVHKAAESNGAFTIKIISIKDLKIPNA